MLEIRIVLLERDYVILILLNLLIYTYQMQVQFFIENKISWKLTVTRYSVLVYIYIS